MLLALALGENGRRNEVGECRHGRVANVDHRLVSDDRFSTFTTAGMAKMISHQMTASTTYAA
jgi:hypothetical protein